VSSAVTILLEGCALPSSFTEVCSLIQTNQLGHDSSMAASPPVAPPDAAGPEHGGESLPRLAP